MPLHLMTKQDWQAWHRSELGCRLYICWKNCVILHMAYPPLVTAVLLLVILASCCQCLWEGCTCYWTSSPKKDPNSDHNIWMDTAIIFQMSKQVLILNIKKTGEGIIKLKEQNGLWIQSKKRKRWEEPTSNLPIGQHLDTLSLTCHT